MTGITRYMPIEVGKVTVTAAQATATKVEVTLPATPAGVVCNVYRAGVDTTGMKVSISGTKITFENVTSGFTLTENDVISYIAI